MPLRLLAAALLLFATAAGASEPDAQPAAPSDADVERAIDAAGGLPALPDAPPPNLVAPPPAEAAVPAAAPETAAPAAPPKPPALTVELAATDAVGNAPVQPGEERALRVVVNNRGAEPLAGVTITARADAAQIQPSPGWRLDGAAVRTEVSSLATAAYVSLPLTLKAANVVAAGEGKARLSVEVAATGAPAANAEFAWTVRDCPGAFREKLQAVRNGPLADMRRAWQTLRRGDATLPGWLSFAAGRPMVRGPAGDPLRLAAALASRRGSDPEFGRTHMAYTVDRTILELDTYLNQRAIASLCTGVPNLVKSYREAFAPAERRLDQVRQTLEKVRQPPAAAGTDSGNGVGGNDDLVARTRRVAIGAGLLAEDAPTDPTALAVLVRARNAIAAGKRATPAGAEALADLEIEAWLTEGATNASRVSNAFSATLGGIQAAHEAACTCAW